MTDALTTFNLKLNARMKDVENRFSAFNAKVGNGAEEAGKELRHQITALEKGAAEAKIAAESSAAFITRWVADSVSSVEEWKTKFDVGMLTARAERADQYAAAASEVALAAVDAAETAALDARLAHADVTAAGSSSTTGTQA